MQFKGCLVSLCLRLGACSSLPRIVPDMAPPATTPTQVENAQGPLSPARSRAILEGLERGADDTNIFDRHLALEQAVSDSPLLTGNRVRLLEDGPDTYRAMFTGILDEDHHSDIWLARGCPAFLPLSLGLMAKGHIVKLAAPSRFESLVEGYGIQFVPLAGEPEELSRRFNARGITSS